jgi:hypothetical protein
MNVAPYRKFIVALGAAVGVLASTVAGQDNFSLNDGIAVALAFLGSLGVYAARNQPPSV